METPVSTPGINVLVVDDTPANLRLLVELLSKQGYIVRPAVSGTQALTAVREELPDLILLDVKMPGMNGYEVCQTLKADERTRDIPVIFITALQGVADKVKAFETGGVDFISKPFLAEEVLSRVKTHLSLYHVHKQLEDKNVSLETAKTSLEQANRELKSFAYIVSHDLKAPLRGLSNLVHWLVEDYAGAFDANGQEMVELLLSRVKRMSSMIDGILRYSRAGRLIDGRQERIDLNALVKDVIDMLEPPDHIRVIIERELPCISGETTSIKQIFQNLLNNAIKYMDKTEGIIRIRSEETDRFWTFRVADNGPGVEKQHHEKIFNIFQTLGPEDDADSSGIGLTIVKKLVERYGGEVRLESTSGEGSEFSFTLLKEK